MDSTEIRNALERLTANASRELLAKQPHWGDAILCDGLLYAARVLKSDAPVEAAAAMVRAEARGRSAHQRMVLVLGGGSAAGARPVSEDERPALPGIRARDRRLHGKVGGANSRRRLRAASAGARSVDRRLLLHRARARAARPNLRRLGDDRARGGSDDPSSRSSDRSWKRTFLARRVR